MILEKVVWGDTITTIACNIICMRTNLGQLCNVCILIKIFQTRIQIFPLQALQFEGVGWRSFHNVFFTFLKKKCIL